ncbi:hypothetical protein H4R33_006531 [Dimargaris cristalligena]|uniref:FAD dependent oxidoreductase domain-containing protein n=1 Tax=Dimargaris cristalligena TaxID=215637 RepID=A0A4P9ZV97_9FUNG|nr:hypothetical protein H4R33_006531 [Dimargaris cristalligena]RKP37514.1 hypothetical protein BJ085DRAFT_25001 [Dimargaris cristalligena]|eukprot:RKP37514.1 hypothetical protein BJ085DRAFT_25001 [Dimargaris cristalligena]
MSPAHGTEAVVLGAGVTGLTTALLLQQSGFRVTLVARNFPGDMSTPYYTSPWAGANWCGWAAHDQYDQQGKWAAELTTLGRLLRLAAENPECGVFSTQACLYSSEQDAKQTRPWFWQVAPEYRQLSAAELPPDCRSGATFQTVCINVPRYLQWLLNQFEMKGGQTLPLETNLDHLDELWTRFPTVELLVNCTGLQARDLGGVRDPAVFPIRGQTVLVRAPNIHRTIAWEGPNRVAYIIPRGDGSVVLGGTIQRFSEETKICPRTSDYILSQCLKICPSLVDATEVTQQTPVQKLRSQVIRESVGFRPARVGGPRVEAQHVGRVGLLCHNYGHGGFGYQTSWGYAYKALQLVEQLRVVRQLSHL